MRKAENLLLLVAFAGNQNHVAGLGLPERQANGGGAVRLDGVANAARLQSRLDLGQNRQRLLGAGIVACGDHKVASLPRGLAHLGTLGAVAVAAAAEERDHAAAGLRRHLAGKGGQIAQGVVGVGVVHNHREGLAGIDGLKAAGNGLEAGNEFDQIGKRHATRMGRGEGGQQVENVHLAGETRDDFGRAGRGFEFEHRAGGRERMGGGAPVALANSVGPDLSAGLRCRVSQFGSARVMRVDHGNARSRIDRAVKEQSLGGKVLLHRLVVIEVVAGEIGEDSHIEVDPGGAALIKGVAGNFGDQLGGSAGYSLGHKFKQISRLGGGVNGRAHFARHVVLDGANENGLARCGVEQRLDQKCRGRLAIGSRNPRGREPDAPDGQKTRLKPGRARGDHARLPAPAGQPGRPADGRTSATSR